MLPFDNRPWAKALARLVIGLSLFAAIVGAYLFYANDDLHIPEVAIIVLLLLTILPPNIAIVMRKAQEGSDTTTLHQPHLRTR
jgi:hypothetical protein